MTGGVLLLGASGLAREVLAAGVKGVVGILDDDDELHGRRLGGVPVLGRIDDAAHRDERLLVCVGSGRGRSRIVDRLGRIGVSDSRYDTFVAPSARIGATNDIGHGSIVLDGVVITADARIGRHTVIMPNCTITHDDVLEDFVTLAAGVSLAGGVTVRHSAYVGMNASVRQGTEIGRSSMIGMGAVVLSDVPQDQTWAGVPARALGADA